jgi:hypothetical protein
MKCISLFLISFFFVKFCHCQNDERLLIGEWTLKEVSGVVYVECPDVIKIDASKKYEVLNDCYGIDPKHPLLEEGIWSFNEKEKKLTFKNRVFKLQQFQGADIIEYNILEISETTLKVNYVSEDGLVTETFKKDE